MTRQEALEKWKEEEKDYLEEKKRQFFMELQEKAEEVSNVIKQAFSSLREEITRGEKEKIMFFYFSLLRIDILKKEYNVLAQAMDARWYMDRSPAEVTFSLDFLFSMLDEIRERLELDERKYMGKVGRHDISNFLLETAMEWNQILAGQLRFLFRDIEENRDFADIPKLDTWGIYWGEYRDASELIACVDREKKEQKDWDRALRLTGEQETAMVSKFWYQAELRDSDCRGKLLLFSQFENCSLTNLRFTEADLSGAQFKNCTIKACSFQNAVMRQADFVNCVWEDNDFSGADLSYSIFMEKDVPFLHLEPEQLQTILIDRGAK
ncbi:pentapeptide repeat-containing protein [Clostridium sp. Marseille-P2415]|uniref:pentapeptide repeat-containing protein n=1 Tax=Clostridium sp. Marseille-P2415 TaxID=1805471 RepID=UPI00098869BA|nr:pentapeptide repeat-containing protein [Clostridium sp. Marseille-P2415]